eukprot:Seg2139.6 transcript_id=Seg2139.6/GoldUCD/mRNA.D3Y31 product="hypothetical protein" protein_id=Seg2139.6/GoldUCD/D3Y31
MAEAVYENEDAEKSQCSSSTMDDKLPLELLVKILDCLPGRQVRRCKRVCKAWKIAAEIVLLKPGRIGPKTAVFWTMLTTSTKTSTNPNSLLELRSYIEDSCVDSQCVILLSQSSHSAHDDKSSCQNLMKMFENSLQKGKEGLAEREKSLKVIGCTVNCPFGPSDARFTRALIDTSMTLMSSMTTSVLLLPRSETYEIGQFHIPMKKKYEMIQGFKHFLPTFSQKVPLVLAFIHPVTLGRLCNFVKAVREAYSKDTCIVGLYSEHCVYNSSTVTTNEIMGIVLSGDVECMSVLVDSRTFLQDSKVKVQALHERMVNSVAEKDYSKILLVFAPKALEYSNILKLLAVVRKTFLGAPIFGAFVKNAFGADHNVGGDCGFAGGRDYLQSKSVVLSLILIRKGH